MTTSELAILAFSAVLAAGCAAGPGDEIVLRYVNVLPPAATVLAGETTSFRAFATMSDGTTGDFTSAATWTTSDPGVAMVSAGIARGVAFGATTVVASLHGQTSGVITATAQLMVEQYRELRVAPAKATVPLGLSLQCKAIAITASGASIDVTSTAEWSSNPTGRALIDASGLVTTISKGTTTVTAARGGLKANLDLAIAEPVITTMQVTPSTALLATGDSLSFQAAAQYSDGSSSKLTVASWQSSNANVAAVTPDGVATAKQSGQVTLSMAYLGHTGTAILVVADSALKSIAVAPIEVELPVGKTAKLVASATLVSEQELTYPQLTAWTTSNPTVATVDTDGQVTARQAGQATVVATLFGKTAAATVIVPP